MDVSNFTSPLEAVQMISIFSYMNTLSDILIAEKFLSNEDRHQHIPVVNALYHYFIDETDYEKLETKKIDLAQKLISGTDLYGTKENEKLDKIYVNTLYRHIITSLVFGKYANIYGFVAQVVRRYKDFDVPVLMNRIHETLQNAQYLNEDGSLSSLDPLVAFEIVQEFIRPMLPEPKANFTLLSLDYTYAQAGSIFFHSLSPTPVFDKFSRSTKDPHEFSKYVSLAHVVVHSVSAGNVSSSVLKIFALPALLHYILSGNEELDTTSIESIISNSAHWTEAYKLLFVYIDSTFKGLETARQKDYRLQFYQSMTTFKNRTILAKEMIQRKCGNVTDIDEEAKRYKNNPDDYKCNGVKLSNINDLYQQEVKRTTDRFYTYEKETIRDLFNEIAPDINTTEVEISRGYYMLVAITSRQSTLDPQEIKKSDDMFRFYFPKNRTSAYYALLREGTAITLIREYDDPVYFRQKLALDDNEYLNPSKFYERMKTKDESFEVFLDKIAERRSKEFRDSLSNQGYDQTMKEWWIELGLSLLPFHVCRKSIVENDINEAIFACSLDALMIIPFAGEVGQLSLKFLSTSTKALFRLTGTSLTACLLRDTLLETMPILNSILEEETVDFQEHILNLGTSALRLVDPGFELLFHVGKWGFKSLTNSFRVLGSFSKFFEFPGVRQLLEDSKSLLEDYKKPIGDGIYVKFLSKEGGYGQKFVYLTDGKMAEIRDTYEMGEVPVVFANEHESYYAIGSHNEVVQNVRLKNRIGPEAENKVVGRIKIKSYHNSKLCGVSRRRRSPDEISCLRTDLLEQKEKSDGKVIKYMASYSTISEDKVRAELRNYVFSGNTELKKKFAREWASLLNEKKLQLPSWSEQYRVDDPEMFYGLRYNSVLDKDTISEVEATQRMKNLLPGRIISTYDVETLVNDFIETRAYESVTFEDYVALEYYMTNGYKRIGDTSQEAKAMREAFYRLAIRQSDDPFPEGEMILYRGGKKNPEGAENLFNSDKDEYEFIRFTSTTENQAVAESFQLEETENDNDLHMLYVMKFKESFFRANLESVLQMGEVETVLLPGSKFKITEVTKYKDGWKDCMRVELTFMHESMSKEQWYKKAMDELEKLKHHGASPYIYDQPPNLTH